MKLPRRTLEEIEQDGSFFSALIKFLKDKNGGVLSQELRECLEDSIMWSAALPRILVSWTGQAQALCERISTANFFEEELQIFWIRLHGILTEAAPFFDDDRTIFKGSYSQRGKDCLKALSNSLTPEEHIFIEYQRHQNTHINPEYFQKTPLKGKDGKVNLKREYRTKSIDEISQILWEMQQKESRDAKQFASNIAKRLLPALGELHGVAELAISELLPGF